MRNKLNYLTGVSLKRKIKTKWFFAANALMAVVVVGLINIDSVITFFGGDFNDQQKIHVVDNSKKSYDVFNQQLETVEKSIFGDESDSFEVVVAEKTKEEIIKEDKKAIVIEINADEKAVISVIVTSDGFIDAVDNQVIITALNNTKTAIALSETEVPEEEIAKLYSPLQIDREILDDTKNSEEEMQNAIMSTVFPFFILPFFMLTIFLVQMIGAEVNDEKTTRGMEIIISNVSPKTHFFSKVLAGNIFVLLQGGLFLLFGGLGLLLRNIFGKPAITSELSGEIGDMLKMVMDSSFGQNLIYIIPLTIVLMVLTFIAYSLLAGILASMTTNIEDFQQLQTPIIIVSLIGYYLSMMAGLFQGAVFIKALSFVPLISAILSPSLLVLGQIGVVEVFISIALMVVFNYMLIKYGLRVYKVGILNYSTTGLWKKMFKALKNN